ncbi:2-dehydro-3-deoxygalactonokinase [Sulfitobacter sp. PS-8MA]|uniref:2-dehydro-3-deoxygalactonokinase n=1 Tax=Sulfitobacter sp. PS-8MA TaxID=3237707 RepID=UPI0034C6705D
MAELRQVDWLAVEWFERRLSVWAMQGGTALEATSGMVSDDGEAGFDAALAQLIAPWDLPARLPVFAAGLPLWSGAAPRAVPCDAVAAETVARATAAFDLQIIPGLRQTAPSGLLQGAETRIAGFLSLNKDWDGVICLPGATTAWAQVSAGEVVSFQNFLTGELIATLGDGPAPADTALDDTAFDDALSDGLSRPERLAARLASLRTERMLDTLPAPTAQAQLAGILIGAELAAARPYWLGQSLAVIGPEAEARLYMRALGQQGAMVTEADAARMALAGISAVRRGEGKG